MLWARMVAYVTGTVNQELLLRNEYLGAENRILRGQIKGGLLLSEGEKATLAEIAQRLGRKALEALAAVAKPDTLLARYRKLIANKFDGSRFRQRVGRIVGALKNLGHQLSHQTVGNILRQHGLSPAPKRKQAICWKDFIRSNMEVLVGTEFFTVEVLTGRKKRSSAMSGEARWPPEVLRAAGGVGIEVGTASHVWQSHIHICKDACRLVQAKGLARLIYHEPALEVRFMRRAAGTTRILTIRP
jgi:hypothetical protein